MVMKSSGTFVSEGEFFFVGARKVLRKFFSVSFFSNISENYVIAKGWILDQILNGIWILSCIQCDTVEFNRCI